MKKILFMLLLCMGIFTILVACDGYLLFEGSKNSLKNLNKGEVGNQDIWLTDWNESKCAYSGCKAVYTVRQGESLPYLWVAIRDRANKAVTIEAVLAEGEKSVGAVRQLSVLVPDRKGVSAYNVIGYPYTKMNWMGARVLTWKITIIDQKNSSKVLEEHSISVKMIGVE